jgi:hypothetical protein
MKSVIADNRLQAIRTRPLEEIKATQKRIHPGQRKIKERRFYSPIVPFVASCNNGPKVLPLSLLILMTGRSFVSLVTHHHHIITSIFTSNV